MNSMYATGSAAFGNSACASEVSKASPVDIAISDVNSACSDLEDMASSLESALAPILTPEPPNKSGEAPRPVGASPLVDTLQAIGERQRRAAGRLQSILSRITV